MAEMLKCNVMDIAALQVGPVSQFGSTDSSEVVSRTRPRASVENADQSSFIETTVVQNIRDLVKENAFSHLMEVILEVAPDALFDEIFMKILKDLLYDISSHHYAKFAVQALISYARNQDQVNAICEELGPKIKDLLKMG